MKEKENHKADSAQNNYRVIYDMQRDEYIKINKQLGTEVKVYKDGTDIKKFQPGLTGQFNSTQRFRNQSTSLYTELSGSMNSRNLDAYEHRFVVRRRLPKHRTIEVSPENNRHIQTNIEHHTISKSQDHIFPAITQKDFFQKLIANREKVVDKPTEPTDALYQTLKRFNEFKKDTIYENHSLKKDIPGSSPRVSPERINFANKKYFETLIADVKKPEQTSKNKINKGKIHVQMLPKSFTRTQYLRQRDIFFKVHPDKKSPEKEHDEHRRQNLMRLEKEFIEQNQKATNKIYSK